MRRAASNNDRQVAELMREQMGIQRELQDALREAKIEEKKISSASEEANNTVKQLKISLKNSETAREASENKVKTEAVKAAASASKEAEAKAAINAKAAAKAANCSIAVLWLAASSANPLRITSEVSAIGQSFP